MQGLQKTVLIVPPNDAEAILISSLAQKIKLQTILSRQTHGASLDKGRDYLPEIKEGGYTRVVVVEMPGLKTEAKLKKLGIDLVTIDHHHYTNLNRSHPRSSLEQFLSFFHLTDKKIAAFGFNARLVRGIGVLDRGFIWSLQEEGYTKQEIEEVLAFHDELLSTIHNPRTEKHKQKIAHDVWKKRKKWDGYFIVETKADIQLRPRLSRIVALEIGKPTSLIIIEHRRKLIYVQESDDAMKLFEHFGGFTFGQNRNWGYRNEEGKKHVGLREVKKQLASYK